VTALLGHDDQEQLSVVLLAGGLGLGLEHLEQLVAASGPVGHGERDPER
jgi:hypothetical protein